MSPVTKVQVVDVKASDGSIVECVLDIAKSEPWRLIFSGFSMKDCVFVDRDLFEALLQLRQALEDIGAQILCVGARPDVFPSGMARSMSGARKAYITRIGEATNRADLIDIFDYAEPELVGSVEQQKLHQEKWRQSLKKGG